MKLGAVVACLVAAALGAVSGGLTATLVAGAPDRPPTLAAVPTARTADELLTQMRELRAQNRELQERMTALELRLQPALRDPADSVSEQDFEAFSAEVREWMSGRGVAVTQAAAADPELVDQVTDALQSIRKEERIAQARRGLDKEAANLEERVTRLSDWLELDDYQAGEVRSLLIEKDARDRELLQLWEDGVDDEVLGETKRTNRAELYVAIERVLTPRQYETFQSKFGGGGKN